jgi:hypothetical protein
MGHDYGIGADLASGSPMGLAVKPERSQVAGAPGGALTLEISRVASTQDAEEKLGISADVSYGCGVFGGSARFKFAKSCKVHSESLFLGIFASTTIGFESIDDPILTQDAIALASDRTGFGDRYGTMFVRGIERGGLFFAVLQIETSSAEQASDIDGELKGSYGLFSAEASMNIQEAIARHKASASVLLHAEGGDQARLGPYIDTPFEPSKLLQATEIWVETVLAEPVPSQVVLAPLVIARGAPSPPNAADLQKAQDVLIRCTQLRSIFLDGLNTVTYVAIHQDRYSIELAAEGHETLAALQVHYAKAVELVARSAREAIRDPAAAKMPESYFASESLEMPSIPTGLYSALGNNLVEVPDLSSTGSWAACLAGLQAVGLSGQQLVDIAALKGGFKVLSTLPPAHMKVEKGSSVTVMIPAAPPFDASGIGVKMFKEL